MSPKYPQPLCKTKLEAVGSIAFYSKVSNKRESWNFQNQHGKKYV